MGISSIVLNGDYTLTINYTDGNSTTTASIRGETGATGQTGPAGANAYVHIKYSATQPTQDSDMKDTADAWMGIYSGSSSTAPTAYTSYTWYKIKGEDGAGAVEAVKMNGSTIQPDQDHIVDLGTVITSHQDISGKVDKDQGSTYAGKVLGIGNDGMVTPVPFSGDDFTGATASTAGVHGYVPAPSAGDQDLVLTGGGTWEESPGAKVVEVTGTITNTSGAYSGSISDQRVVSGMKLVGYELGTPTVFNANIEITPGSGSVAIACSDVAGTSTIKIKLLKVMDDPTTMTSAEFDILDNRIGDLTDLDTTAKTDIVSAINEHESDISTLSGNIETKTISSVAGFIALFTENDKVIRVKSTGSASTTLINHNARSVILTAWKSGDWIYYNGEDTEGIYGTGYIQISTQQATYNELALNSDLASKQERIKFQGVWGTTLTAPYLATYLLTAVEWSGVAQYIYNHIGNRLTKVYESTTGLATITATKNANNSVTFSASGDCNMAVILINE